MGDEFATEQRALAANCWQFIGLRDALEVPNSWLRRTLFGIDIFVQNFEGELRGFHNVCSHRGFPLRREPAGVGPVQCGFHGWGYNGDGVPTSVPRNAEMFGLSREQRLALALPAVRVEAIGRFVFASVAISGPSLTDYLGPYADVYRAIASSLGSVILREETEVRADWKLHTEISLDDYHVVAVHPTTFGAAGAEPLHKFVYRRDGQHSCLLRRRDADWSFDGFWADLRKGVMDRSGYKIFNCFPGIILAVMPTVCIATSVTALAPDSTLVDNHVLVWNDPAPTAEESRGIADYTATVFREDHETCEQWQTGRQSQNPVIGKLEERVAWFRETYAEVIRRGAGDFQTAAAERPR